MPNSSRLILTTDRGAHSPTAWALATADHLVHYDPATAPAETVLAAQRLEVAIADILTPHHFTVQRAERGALVSDGGMARLGASYEPHEHIDLDAVVAEIVAAAAGTPFAAKFAGADFQATVRAVIAGHFTDSMHVERLWHAERHPGDPTAQAFKAAQTPAPAQLAAE